MDDSLSNGVETLLSAKEDDLLGRRKKKVKLKIDGEVFLQSLKMLISKLPWKSIFIHPLLSRKP